MAREPYKTKSGKTVPSVTDINAYTKPDGLMLWANWVGRSGRSLEDARLETADLGTLTHHLIANYVIFKHTTPEELQTIRDRLFLTQPVFESLYQSASFLLESFAEWWDAQTDTYALEVEVPIVDEYLGFGGQLDCIGYHNGNHTVFDWKTCGGLPTKPKVEHIIQTCAYVHLLKHSKNLNYQPHITIVYISRETGKVRPFILTPEDQPPSAFLGVFLTKLQLAHEEVNLRLELEDREKAKQKTLKQLWEECPWPKEHKSSEPPPVEPIKHWRNPAKAETAMRRISHFSKYHRRILHHYIDPITGETLAICEYTKAAFTGRTGIVFKEAGE